jgi:tetratricopeptide (TPR) repeat protein
METKDNTLAEEEFHRAGEALATDNTLAALASLEKALKQHDNPAWYSFLGYCVAKERGQIKKGAGLCQVSLNHEQDNPVHYLNLGKIYLLAGNKTLALRLFREGLAKGQHEELQRKLHEVGIRKKPIVSLLARSNLINKYLGLLYKRLHWR